jgi:Zn-dependent peptidase ImmA (M78 family)
LRQALDRAETLACAILAESGVGWDVPVPIHRVARRLGLTVNAVRMREDGYLASDDRGLHIFVNAEQPLVRQRFSVAHELGHWAARFDGLPREQVVPATRAFRSEEMLCNTLAGALLIPQQWVRETHPELWRAEEESLEKVRVVAADARVSLEAALVRLRDLCGWSSTILHWRRRAKRPDRPSWRLLAEAGVFPWERGSVLPVPATNDLLTQAGVAGQGIHVGWSLPLRVDSTERDIECDVWVRGDDAVTLVPGRRRRARLPAVH